VALVEGERGALPGVALTSGTRRGKSGPWRRQLSVEVLRGGGGGARLGGGVIGERHRRGGARQPGRRLAARVLINGTLMWVHGVR
jgi:hypothetical protein